MPKYDKSSGKPPYEKISIKTLCAAFEIVDGPGSTVAACIERARRYQSPYVSIPTPVNG